MDFKSINMGTLKKLTSPKAAEDLNHFLEKLPQNAGNTVLIAAGIAWGMAAALGLYTAVQTQTLIELRAELKEMEAVKPMVPKIQNVGISKDEMDKFLASAKKSYRGLKLDAKGSTIAITANSTARFTEFREAIGHVQNGGNGWRVSLDKLCVGRECDKGTHLMVSLSVNKAEVKTVNIK